jgi:hypothetical protein
VTARPDDVVKDPRTAIAKKACGGENQKISDTDVYRRRARAQGDYWQVWLGGANDTHRGNPMTTVYRHDGKITPCFTCVD